MTKKKYVRPIQLPTPSVLRKKARRLVSHPFLLFLAVASNAQILLGASAIYHLESGLNKEVGSFLDALVWAVGIVTTVGIRDIAPITTAGKIVQMILMILGTATFCAYAALFADALISDEFEDFEVELRGIERRLLHLKVEDSTPADVTETLAKIESHIMELKETNSRRRES